ncbi:MAG: hypothetical protein ACK5Q7_03595 [Cyanobacteriota bacterium]
MGRFDRTRKEGNAIAKQATSKTGIGCCEMAWKDPRGTSSMPDDRGDARASSHDDPYGFELKDSDGTSQRRRQEKNINDWQLVVKVIDPGRTPRKPLVGNTHEPVEIWLPKP